MASSSTSAFVLEIGSEELPSRFLQGEEAYLAEAFAKALELLQKTKRTRSD